MWKLLQLTISPYNFINRQLLKNGNIHRFSIKETISNRVKTEYVRSINKAKPAVKLLGKTGLIIGFSGIIHTGVRKYTVQCQAKKSRTVGYREASTEINFDWRLFWHYIRPHLLYLIAAITGALAVAILNIQIPQLIGSLINVIVSCKGTTNDKLFINEIKVPALKLVMFYASQSLCTFFYIYMLSKLGENMAYNMKKDLFASILKQDVAFFDSQRTGEIINRLTSDVQDFKSSFKQTVSGGLRATTQIIGCSLSLILISPEMTMVTLACVPAVIGVGTVLASFLRTISGRAQAQNEKTTAVADEAVANIRTVRSFAMEEYEEELYNAEAKLSMELNESLGFGIGWFQAGTNMFLNSMVLATLYMGGYLLTTNKLSPGDLMTYLMATQTVQRSLAQISQLFGAMLRGMASGSRIFDYMKLKPKLPLKGGESIPDEELRGMIEFKNVSFSYPTRPQQRILSNFNLTIPSGKTVAIVGASGNGKSTVVALIERFYDVSSGSITLDGKDIKKLDPNWLRKRVLGLISQEPILFGTSIMENIRYGKPDATDEEVRNAAQLANADQFIETFPRKYNTLVGERGVTLSGGQKQRIAIARALLKNPTILLLDEATSALDAESEKIVQSALDNARQGRTVLVIAHRLSTVRNADIIVVLNKGRIVETGTHEALLKLKGYYWSLVYQQQETTAAG